MNPLLKSICQYVPFNESLEVPDLALAQCPKVSRSQNDWPDLLIDYVLALYARIISCTNKLLKCGNILLDHKFIY